MKVKVKCLESMTRSAGEWVTKGETYEMWRGEDRFYIINNFGAEEWVIEPKDGDNHEWFKRYFELPSGWSFEKVLKLPILGEEEDPFESYDRAMSIL